MFYMSSTSAVDKQISTYLKRLNMEQKKAVLTLLKSYAKVNEEKHSFEQELERRISDYESGKAKVYTMEEAELLLRKLLKSKKEQKK